MLGGGVGDDNVCHIAADLGDELPALLCERYRSVNPQPTVAQLHYGRTEPRTEISKAKRLAEPVEASLSIILADCLSRTERRKQPIVGPGCFLSEFDPARLVPVGPPRLSLGPDRFSCRPVNSPSTKKHGVNFDGLNFFMWIKLTGIK